MRKLVLLTICAISALEIASSSSASAQTYTITPNETEAFFLASLNPNMVPSGANLNNCKSTVDPYPVVLVNGTFSVMEDSFGAFAPSLANAGYCVYTFNYGAIFPDVLQAIGPAVQSAYQLETFVNQVKAETGSSKVDLVGFSQGGLLVEYYTKVLHGAPSVHSLVALGPTTHGTTLEGITNLVPFFPGANLLVGSFCPACVDQEKGSLFVQMNDAGPIAQPGIKYTIIDTNTETVVTPVGSSFILEPGVTNEFVQSFCPKDAVDHPDLSYDNVVIQLTKNALSPSLAKAPNCSIEYPATPQ